MLYNFHTHSCFDDGEDHPENYVKQAIDKGVAALGFSAHAPIEGDDNQWCLNQKDLPDYCNKIRSLKEKYKNEIDIFLGLEMDYIPGISKDFAAIRKKYGLEYIIGSVHLVKNNENGRLWFIDGPEEGYKKGIDKIFEGNVKKAVEAFFLQSSEMINRQKPDIIGHLDKIKMHNKGRYFNEDEKWYHDNVDMLLEAIEKNKTIVEVNTRGKYTEKTDSFFPSVDILKKCLLRKIPVMINTDAHEPRQVDRLFDEAKDLLRDIGFKETQTPFFRSKIN